VIPLPHAGGTDPVFEDLEDHVILRTNFAHHMLPRGNITDSDCFNDQHSEKSTKKLTAAAATISRNWLNDMLPWGNI
jgi:hypothetical protein